MGKITSEALERIGFRFEPIGHNDFDLIGSYFDDNGIEVSSYNDGTFGVPYGVEGNVMNLKSLEDLILLRKILTGDTQ